MSAYSTESERSMPLMTLGLHPLMSLWFLLESRIEKLNRRCISYGQYMHLVSRRHAKLPCLKQRCFSKSSCSHPVASQLRPLSTSSVSHLHSAAGTNHHRKLAGPNRTCAGLSDCCQTWPREEALLPLGLD